MTGTPSAGHLLVRAGVDPTEVRRILPGVEPYAVAVKVAPGWFQMLWFRGIAAITLPWAIYIRRDVFDHMLAGSDPGRTGPLLVHELTHVDQLIRLGVVRHTVQYIGDYLRGRLARRGHWAAYRGVRLEVEARLVAGRLPDQKGGTP